MAIERTFIQQGQGYGSTPVNITAKIGNVVVHTGPVPTVDGIPPRGGIPGGDAGPLVNLFSWTKDSSFVGQQDVEITVDNGLLLMTQTVANYTDITLAGNLIPGNASSFTCFFVENIDGFEIGDPYTEEKINGISQEEHPDPAQLSGQWWWYIPGGSTFTAKLNVAGGNVG